MTQQALPHRQLRNLQVPAIGYGAMVLSPGVYGEIDDDRAVTALRHAFDSGATFVDTSDAYGSGGHNEQLVGTAIRGRRDDVVVATKFGLRVPDGAERHEIPVGFAFEKLLVNADPQYVAGYAEQSLRNLGVDEIDLYYLHYPDPQVPIEDTVGAMAALVRAGKMRHLGLSNVTADELRRACVVHPIAAVQVEWSMWRPAEPDLVKAADDLGVGLVAWSPLGSGFLTGTVDRVEDGDFRRNAPRFDSANLAANIDRYRPVRTMAADLGLTPAQLALAWLLHQSDDVVPIPGSRTPDHIVENIAAAHVDLHPDTLATIDAALANFQPAGGTLL